MIKDEEIILAHKIATELRQTGGTLGIAYLQIKYQLGFAKATRIADYFTEHGYAEQGDFGTISLVDSSGESVDCKLYYRLTADNNL